MLEETFTGAELASEVNDKLSLSNGGVIKSKTKIEVEPAEDNDIVNKGYLDKKDLITPGNISMGCSLSLNSNYRYIAFDSQLHGGKAILKHKTSGFNLYRSGVVRVQGNLQLPIALYDKNGYGLSLSQYYDMGLEISVEYVINGTTIPVKDVVVDSLYGTGSSAIPISIDVPVTKADYGYFSISAIFTNKYAPECINNEYFGQVYISTTGSVGFFYDNPLYNLTLKPM